MQVFEQNEGRTDGGKCGEVGIMDLAKEGSLVAHVPQGTGDKGSRGGGRSRVRAQAANSSTQAPYGGVFVRS